MIFRDTHQLNYSHCIAMQNSTGLGPSQYIGNKRLRDLAMSRKEEYNSSKSYKVKKRIGREIYDEIANRGGRFLQQVGRRESEQGMRQEMFSTRKFPERKARRSANSYYERNRRIKKNRWPKLSSEMNMQDVSEEDLEDNHDDNVADIPPPDVAVSGRRSFCEYWWGRDWV